MVHGLCDSRFTIRLYTMCSKLSDILNPGLGFKQIKLLQNCTQNIIIIKIIAAKVKQNRLSFTFFCVVDSF